MLKKIWSATKNETIQHTIGYYLMLICLGADLALTGPTLPALAAQTGTRLAQMGLLFLMSSIGYTLGTLVSGWIYDRVRGHLVLGVAGLTIAGMLVLAPLVPWFWMLGAIFFCKGVAGGFINIGTNVLLVWMHGDKVAPYMNGMHLFFGLGSLLSPLIVAQVVGVAGGYHWAFWILAGLAALAGLRMLTMPGSPQPVNAQTEQAAGKVRGVVPVPLIISAMLFLFFYVGAEITFGGWIYTYATTLHLASLAGAAYLNSAYWAAFTLGRLLSIPAALRFKPKQVLMAALPASLLVLVVGMVFSHSSVALWVMAIGLGFCIAPVWPTGFTLAGQSIDLTGRLTSIILLGDSLGVMVLPSAVGWVIESSSPRALVFLIAGSLALSLAAVFAMLRLRPRQKGIAAQPEPTR